MYDYPDWKTLNCAEQAAKCRAMARRTLAVSVGSSSDIKERFERIAQRWFELADDIDYVQRANGIRDSNA